MIAGMLGLFQIAVFGLLPTVQVLHHDEDLAALRAQEYATIAFVNQNYEKAWTLFAEEGKSTITKDQLIQAIVKMHNDGFPENVEALQFEPMPGQAAMNIFLVGVKAQSKFYYRFVLTGTLNTGYRVAGFFRGIGQYPPSSMRRDLEKKKEQ